jgi:hypothetical protein
VPDGSEEDLAEGTRLFLMRGAGPQRYHVLVRAADGTILRRQHLDGKNGFVDDR